MAKQKNAEADVDAWFPFYVKDYLGATMSLTTIQHGCYMLLMLAYWKNRGPIDDDDEALAATVKQPLRDWLKIRPRLTGFFEIDAGKWRLPRMDAEREKALRNLGQKSGAGRASAEARKLRNGNGRSTAVETTEGTAGPTADVTDGRTETTTDAERGTERQSNSPPTPLPRHPAFGSLSARATDGPTTPIARDWKPSEPDQAWAVGEALTAMGAWGGAETDRAVALAWADRTAEKFRDYWLSVDGQKADWSASWRNWVRTEIDKGSGPKPSAPPPEPSTVTVLGSVKRHREATEAEIREVLEPLFGGGRLHLVRLITDACMEFHRWQLIELGAGRIAKASVVRPKDWLPPPATVVATEPLGGDMPDIPPFMRRNAGGQP